MWQLWISSAIYCMGCTWLTDREGAVDFFLPFTYLLSTRKAATAKYNSGHRPIRFCWSICLANFCRQLCLHLLSVSAGGPSFYNRVWLCYMIMKMKEAVHLNSSPGRVLGSSLWVVVWVLMVLLPLKYSAWLVFPAGFYSVMSSIAWWEVHVAPAPPLCLPQ